jgi:hypothetical protein
VPEGPQSGQVDRRDQEEDGRAAGLAGRLFKAGEARRIPDNTLPVAL